MVTLFISARPTNVSRVRSVQTQKTPSWHWRQIRPTIHTMHASYPLSFTYFFFSSPSVSLYCTLFLCVSFMAALFVSLVFSERNPFKVLFISLAFTTWQWTYHLIHLFLSKHYFALLLQSHFTERLWLGLLRHSKCRCWSSTWTTFILNDFLNSLYSSHFMIKDLMENLTHSTSSFWFRFTLERHFYYN